MELRVGDGTGSVGRRVRRSHSGGRHVRHFDGLAATATAAAVVVVATSAVATAATAAVLADGGHQGVGGHGVPLARVIPPGRKSVVGGGGDFVGDCSSGCGGDR